MYHHVRISHVRCTSRPEPIGQWRSWRLLSAEWPVAVSSLTHTSGEVGKATDASSVSEVEGYVREQHRRVIRQRMVGDVRGLAIPRTRRCSRRLPLLG